MALLVAGDGAVSRARTSVSGQAVGSCLGLRACSPFCRPQVSPVWGFEEAQTPSSPGRLCAPAHGSVLTAGPPEGSRSRGLRNPLRPLPELLLSWDPVRLCLRRRVLAQRAPRWPAAAARPCPSSPAPGPPVRAALRAAVGEGACVF